MSQLIPFEISSDNFSCDPVVVITTFVSIPTSPSAHPDVVVSTTVMMDSQQQQHQEQQQNQNEQQQEQQQQFEDQKMQMQQDEQTQQQQQQGEQAPTWQPPKRRKARRAPRKDKRTFKPYSVLTWQERKELDARESLLLSPEKPNNSSNNSNNISSNNNGDSTITSPRNSRHRKHGRKGAREQPPPAPRNLTQMIIAEHMSPDSPDEYDDAMLLNHSHTSSEESATDFFDKAYDEGLYDELADLNKEALIARIRQRDRELESLHEQLRQLRDDR